MFSSVQLETVQVNGVGMCISAVDFVSMTCNKTRKEAQNAVNNMLYGSDKQDVASILCQKATVLGFTTETYVVTYDECYDLLQYLPRTKRVRDVRKYIDQQFARIRAGDESLHAEIDARAADNGVEAQMARSSLGLCGGGGGVGGGEGYAALAEDVEERALKRRMVAVTVREKELKNERVAFDNDRVAFDNQMYKVVTLKNTFERVFNCPEMQDARDMLMLKDKCMDAFYAKPCDQAAASSAAATLTNRNDSGLGGIQNTMREETTVDEVMTKAGYKPTPSTRVKMGRVLAAEYERRYGKKPTKCTRYVDGAQLSVNSYLRSEESWMIDAVRAYFNEESEEIGIGVDF